MYQLIKLLLLQQTSHLSMTLAYYKHTLLIASDKDVVIICNQKNNHILYFQNSHTLKDILKLAQTHDHAFIIFNILPSPSTDEPLKLA